jgi:hypothetical protein
MYAGDNSTPIPLFRFRRKKNLKPLPGCIDGTPGNARLVTPSVGALFKSKDTKGIACNLNFGKK